MGRYHVIYADPPWNYAQKAKGDHFRGGSVKHYPSMSYPQLRDLRPWLADKTHKDCCLFLWATGPMCHQALDLMADWGFTYKTVAFVWVKTTKAGRPRMGLGTYTRSSCEYVFLGTKGRVGSDLTSPSKTPRLSIVRGDVPQVVQAPVGGHSVKPREVKERIGSMFNPHVGKLELFAREKTGSGWDHWGDEV